MTLPGAAALLCLCLIHLPAAADGFLPVRNEAALARPFGLPALGRGDIIAPHGAAWHLTFDWTSEFHTSSTDRESIVLDGEIAQLAFAYRTAWGESIELGLRVPVVHFGGGILDRAIENWHDLWGLPSGGRKTAPRDRLLYRYERDGETVLEFSRSGASLGDVTLQGGLRLGERTALRGQLRVPTGNADRLSGGGAPGIAAWLDRNWSSGAWSAFASGGALYADRGDLLTAQQRRFVPLAAAGLGWHLNERVRLIGQLYGHGKLHKDSDLRPLKRHGLQLTLGSTIRLGEGLELLAAFQEDPIVASSPDFSLHFGLRYR